MHAPADIGRELHRLRAGQKHAEVQCRQIARLVDPALLVDDDAMHERDLARRAAKRDEPDLGPHLQSVGEWRALGRCGGVGHVGPFCSGSSGPTLSGLTCLPRAPAKRILRSAWASLPGLEPNGAADQPRAGPLRLGPARDKRGTGRSDSLRDRTQCRSKSRNIAVRCDVLSWSVPICCQCVLSPNVRPAVALWCSAARKVLLNQRYTNLNLNVVQTSALTPCPFGWFVARTRTGVGLPIPANVRRQNMFWCCAEACSS